MSEFPTPGEWRRIGPTTSVMEVLGGCVMREEAPKGYDGSISLCFIPYRNLAMDEAMERWIGQAVEAHRG